VYPRANISASLLPVTAHRGGKIPDSMLRDPCALIILPSNSRFPPAFSKRLRPLNSSMVGIDYVSDALDMPKKIYSCHSGEVSAV